MDATISVITPVYKGNTFLPILLNYLLDAASKVKEVQIEWILINDYPHEELTKLTSSISNFKIRVINNKHNIGIHASRINGLKHASGKYVLFLDQDDKVLPQIFKYHLNMIKGFDVSLSNGFNEMNQTYKPIFKNLSQMKKIGKISTFFYVGNMIVSPGMALIRKNAIPQEWISNELSINGADDWLLWTTLLKNKAKFNFGDVKLYYHIKTGNNASDNIKKMVESSIEANNIDNVRYPEDKKKCGVYKRRLKMWVNISIKSKNKIVQYILNPDILLYMLFIKVM